MSKVLDEKSLRLNDNKILKYRQKLNELGLTKVITLRISIMPVILFLFI